MSQTKIQSLADIVNNPLSDKEIRERTRKIYDLIRSQPPFMGKGNFECISAMELKALFELYDQHFFHGLLGMIFPNQVEFEVSSRMTKASFMITYIPAWEDYKLVVSKTLLLQTFKDVQRNVEVAGIVCHNRLEVVMHIMEFMMIFLVQTALSAQPQNLSDPEYRSRAKSVFGHINEHTNLVTQKERAFKIFNLQVWDIASFNFKDQVLQGEITRINQRATVMVKDPEGEYHDDQGNWYTEYNMPLEDLTPLKQ